MAKTELKGNMAMFRKLAAKHLPYPPALREAVRMREAAVSFAPDGAVAYIIAPTCHNPVAVLGAIEQRKRWELWGRRC